MKCINVHLTSYYRLFNICFDPGFFRSKPSVVSLKNFQAVFILSKGWLINLLESVEICMILMLIINSTNLFPFQVSELLFRLEYFRFVKSAFSITCELSKKMWVKICPKRWEKSIFWVLKSNSWKILAEQQQPLHWRGPPFKA